VRIRRSQWSAVAARAMAAAAGLVALPLVLGHLGKSAYGLWMVIASVGAWMQLAELGLTSGVGNALAEANGRDDRMAASAYIATALACLSAIAVAGLGLVFFAAGALPWHSIVGNADSAIVALAPPAFIAVGAVFFVTLPLSLAYTICLAHQRAYIGNWLQAGAAFVSLAAIYAAVRLRLPLPAIVVAASVGQILVLVLLWIFLGRAVPGTSVAPGRISRAALRRISRSSIPLFLFQIGALATNQLVNIVLSHLSSLSLVADYNALLAVYLAIFSLGAALSLPYYPAIREAFERRDGAWIHTALRQALALRLGVAVALGSPLLLIGDWAVRFWIRQPLERPFGWTGWLLFLACMVLASTSSMLSEVLSGLDDIWFQVALVFATAAVVLLAMFLLVPSLGVAGVFGAMAMSTALPIVVCWRRLRAMVTRV
jgi:O-antigen/teichoic acid export membrane protein